MIRLKRSVLNRLDPQSPTVDAVCATLQSAIELEHATIPVYLYALYSLDAHKNAAIAGIIQSVVIEEMLHMVLAANVLNALGGTPVVDTPDFIPRFPGPLPGDVDSELTVHLRPFSTEQLDLFLDIEEPEHPINYKTFRSAALPEGPVTIGQFYGTIIEALGNLPAGSFANPPRHQVGPDLMREAVIVTDLASAQEALRRIVEQGEGTSRSPLEGDGGGIAHYYRFMQIKKGKALIATPGVGPVDEQYAYGGAAVPFDDTGVFPAPADPLAANYPAGGVARFQCDRFNYSYTALLKSLHALLGGDGTGDRMKGAIGLMMSLKSQAKAMMAAIPNPAFHTGPSFEYLDAAPVERPRGTAARAG
ncbi:ferritin-like protein [Pseudoduganella flava]|nr:ferritin-like protein [Pseudoduganella flava]TWI46684.1 ferritin-like protein [Pseudoduganella flava]